MPELIKNRSFLTPRTTNGAVPDGWTRVQNTPSWGGPTWQTGVWRATQGGSFPTHGDRCLMVGADDTQTSTVSGGLAQTDDSIVQQTVSGRAFRDVRAVRVDYTVADAGGDPSNTMAILRITDGSTIVSNVTAMSAITEFDANELTVATTALSNDANWTISVGLERSASNGSTLEIPRAYFDNMRCEWSAYTATPFRILKYSDDLAANASTSITGTAPSTGYALSNVANRRASHPCVFDSATSVYVEFDLGTATEVTLAALVDCDIDASDTWVLTGGTSTAPSSVSYQFPNNDSKNSFVEGALGTYRYWRLTCTNASAKQWVIGEICFGKAKHLQQNFSWGATPSTDYKSVKMTTAYGSEWVYDIGARRSYQMSFSTMSDADLADLKDIYDDSHGDVYPLLIVPRPDSYDCYYGTINSSFSQVERFVATGTVGTIPFLEQARAVVQS